MTDKQDAILLIMMLVFLSLYVVHHLEINKEGVLEKSRYGKTTGAPAFGIFRISQRFAIMY